jgi:menaquinone-dependent protoporphyrinogen IX oxidase
MDDTYNGWKNRQTWNVSLWINNDEPLYRAAVEYVKEHKDSKKLYSSFIRHERMENDRTPDNIAWLGSRLDYDALNNMMRELVD